MPNKKITDNRTALEKLDSGLLTQFFYRQIKESRSTLQEKHAYSTAVSSALDELRLTSALLKRVNFDDTLKVHNKVIHGENLLNYYAGHFSRSVHQVKDALLRLVDVMSADDSLKKPYLASKDVSPASTLRKHGKVIDKIGIKDLINEWSDNSKEQYTLLDADYRAPVFNQAGIEYVTKRNIASFKKTQQEIIDKQNQTIQAIDDNVQQIAVKLLKHYKVPASYEDQTKLSKEWLDHLSLLEIEHEAASIK